MNERMINERMLARLPIKDEKKLRRSEVVKWNE